MNKLFSVFVFGLLLTMLVPFSMMDAYASDVLYGMAHTGPSGGSTLYTVDTSTGTATPIGPLGFDACSGMDHNVADGTMYAVCGRDGTGVRVLVTVDLGTGAGTEVGVVGTHPFGDRYSDISFRNSDSKLYAYLEPGDGLGTIDIVTAALTVIGSTPSDAGNSIAFDSADDLYHGGIDGLPWGTLDQTTAALTIVGTVSLPPEYNRINAMEWHSPTATMFCSGNPGSGSPTNFLCTVDITTGVVTTVGPSVAGLDALAFVLDTPVGGNYIPIDTSALLLAGVASISMWMIPVVIAGIGIGVFVIKRKNQTEIKENE